MKCPVCKKSIPDDTLKCPYCKARTGLVCKNCNTVNSICDFKCKNCGKFFVPDNRVDELYCSNIYENDKTTSILSDNISQDLQKRGMKFVGSTIIYSFLQAIGVIYSHEKDCFLYKD